METGTAIDAKELAMTLLVSLPEELKPLITVNTMNSEKVRNVVLGKCHYCKEVGQFARNCLKHGEKEGDNERVQKETKGCA